MAWRGMLFSGVFCLFITSFVESIDSCAPGCICGTKSFKCQGLASFPVPPSSAKEVDFLESRFDVPSNAFGHLPLLERVSFRNCDIGVINQCSFSGLSNVGVNINGSRIKAIDSHAFFQLSKFDFTLSHSNISKIKSYAFSSISGVNHWNLAFINVTALYTRAIYNVSKVKKIQIYSSTFEEMRTDAISGLRDIEEFTMFRNNIRNFNCHSIEDIVMTLSSFVFFGNGFYCDCGLAWLWSLDKALAGTMTQIIQDNNCYGPKKYSKIKSLKEFSVADLQCGPVSCSEIDVDSLPEPRLTCAKERLTPQPPTKLKEFVPVTRDTQIPLNYSSEKRKEEAVTSLTSRLTTTTVDMASEKDISSTSVNVTSESTKITTAATTTHRTRTESNKAIETSTFSATTPTPDSLDETETTESQISDSEKTIPQFSVTMVTERKEFSFDDSETRDLHSIHVTSTVRVPTTEATSSIEIPHSSSSHALTTILTPDADGAPATPTNTNVPDNTASTPSLEMGHTESTEITPPSSDQTSTSNVTLKTHSSHDGSKVRTIARATVRSSSSIIETPRSSTDRTSTETVTWARDRTSREIAIWAIDRTSSKTVTRSSDRTSTETVNRASDPTSGETVTRASDRTSTETVNRASDPTSSETVTGASDRTSTETVNRASDPTSSETATRASDRTSTETVNRASDRTSIETVNWVSVQKPIKSIVTSTDVISSTVNADISGEITTTAELHVMSQYSKSGTDAISRLPSTKSTSPRHHSSTTAKEPEIVTKAFGRILISDTPRQSSFNSTKTQHRAIVTDKTNTAVEEESGIGVANKTSRQSSSEVPHSTEGHQSYLSTGTPTVYTTVQGGSSSVPSISEKRRWFVITLLPLFLFDYIFT